MATPDSDNDVTAASPEPPDAAEPERRPSVKAVVTSRQFVAGLFGWYAINIPLWLLVKDSGLICATFPLNVLLLVVLGVVKGTRRIALGVLTALAINAVISLIVGLGMNALCFVPPFDRGL